LKVVAIVDKHAISKQNSMQQWISLILSIYLFLLRLEI